MARTSQIVTGVLLVPYIVCGAFLCILVMDKTDDSSDAEETTEAEPAGEEEAEERSLANLSKDSHGVLCLGGTLLLGFTHTEKMLNPVTAMAALGLAYRSGTVTNISVDVGDKEMPVTGLHLDSIIIYRLLIGTRTRTVKYVHLVLHLLTLTLFGLGISCIQTSSDQNNVHDLVSWAVFIVFCLQFLVAAIIFAYLYPNTKLRLYAAPFHDIVGIWLFICCVACCISGMSRGQKDADKHYDKHSMFYGVSHVCFSLILIIIMSPFFEWDMVGPL